jgi:hypothetical protein
MKKIKSPWYGFAWIVVWTAGLVWMLQLGIFDRTESIGLIIVWFVMVGITVYLLLQYLRREFKKQKVEKTIPAPAEPARNALCSCGSGKKYKRCCGSPS